MTICNKITATQSTALTPAVAPIISPLPNLIFYYDVLKLFKVKIGV